MLIETYWERSVFCATWTVRVLGGDPWPADDLNELRWFPPASLPTPADLAFGSHADILADWASGR